MCVLQARSVKYGNERKVVVKALLSKILVVQTAFILSSIFSSTVYASGFYSELCAKEKANQTEARAKFERCMESQELSEQKNTSEEIALKCSSELSDYNKSNSAFNVCVKNESLVKKNRSEKGK